MALAHGVPGCGDARDLGPAKTSGPRMLARVLVKRVHGELTHEARTKFVTSTLVGGLFVVVPVYLAVLLLLKGMKSVAGPGAANRSAAP